MNEYLNTELSSPEETRGHFSGRGRLIKPGIYLHWHEAAVVAQVKRIRHQSPSRFTQVVFLLCARDGICAVLRLLN